MMKLAITLTAITATACAAGFSFADPAAPGAAPEPVEAKGGDYTVAQKKLMKSVEAQFFRSVANADRWCKTKIRGAIDWPSWIDEVDKQIETGRGPSINGYCSEPMSIAANMCKSDEFAAEAVQKKLKAYTCKFGGEGKRALSLAGGHLVMWVDWKGKNNWDYIKKWLGKHL